jgi:glycosyltransferase involved in cell wall biosynthesis
VVSILVPAYNEAGAIGETVRQIRKAVDPLGKDYEIIVIDDASDDETSSLAEAAGARLVRHPRQGGYGRALKTGMRHAEYDWCAILDADGSYPIERLPDLLSYVPRFDMVVAARTGKIYWGSFGKRVGRLLLLRVAKFVTGTDVPDVNSGMRVFRKELALSHARRISSGFSFTTTLTFAVLLEEHFVRYVPIDYLPRVGRSKVKMGPDSLRMVQIVTQAILYYNPLKLFLPVCLLSVAVGLVGGALVATLDPGLGLLFTASSVLVAIVIGALGFLAEAMRLHRTDPPSTDRQG